jgi:predicted NBD/HSP70 family sugar kinase
MSGRGPRQKEPLPEGALQSGPLQNGPLQNGRVREHNRYLVYRHLKARGKLSRADISRATELSIPTVTAIVQEFLQLGLLTEVGQGVPRGGRPAQLIAFNPRAYTVLSVDLSQPRYEAAIIDLLGEPLERLSGPAAAPRGEEALSAWLEDLVGRYGSRYRIHQVGVSVPGVVDAQTGNVRLASALGWNDFPLARHLSRALGQTVILENDVNALATGELHYGQGQDCRDVAYLSITNGIGFALVLDGRIYRGSRSAAGEIGYSTLEHIPPHPSPSLGQPGPLESHLLGLERAFVTDGVIRLDTPEAERAFAHFCDDLCVILQNALCLLNPERLVIAWPRDAEHRLCRHLRAALKTPAPVEVVPAALGSEGALLGVARLALGALELALCQNREDALP